MSTISATSNNALKPIIPSDKIVPNVQIAENIANQATNATEKVLEKTKTFVEDITEHLPNWVKDTPAKIGEKANDIIKHAAENPKTYLVGGALAALTAGIAIGRISKKNNRDDKHEKMSLEEAIIRDFLNSK